MALPRVLAARPSPLIEGTISTVAWERMSITHGSFENASLRIIAKHASRPVGSFPCTLQFAPTVGDFEIASAVASGAG